MVKTKPRLVVNNEKVATLKDELKNSKAMRVILLLRTKWRAEILGKLDRNAAVTGKTRVDNDAGKAGSEDG